MLNYDEPFVNWDEFEKYLEARSKIKHFITSDKCLGESDRLKILDLCKKYPKTEVIKSISYGGGEDQFIYHPECSVCYKDGEFGEQVVISKTKFIEQFIFAKSPYKCHRCLQNETKERQKEQEKWEIEREQQKIDYIKTYLDPEISWRKGTTTYQKWNEINSYWVDKNLLRSHIKSMKYRDFLKTPYWKAIAEKTKRSAGFKCQMCASNVGLATHHRTYESHGLEHLNLKDLIVLCHDCHEKFHDKIAKEPEE